MKIKHDFVTNSSSSSFIIDTANITDKQMKQLLYHYEIAGSDTWNITLEDNYIKGCTTMDNFDMEEFMVNIGIDINVVEFEEY